REAFTAADLQKYTEIEDGIPIDEILAEMEEGATASRPETALTRQGSEQSIHQYDVTMSRATRAVFGQLYTLAIGAGIGAPFVAAFRKIVDRVRNDPLNMGEPQYRLPALRLQICQAIVAPLIADFAVHEDRPLVFIRGFRLVDWAAVFSQAEVPGTKEDTPMKILRPEEVTTFPPFRELTPEELKEAYRLARESFTAADLQKYTELDEGIPFEEVLAELEEAQRQFDQKSQ
ncbi:MAG TPA: hypothetical protein VJ739_04590, partial [Gemmataceae bacterium]|nr:hypothetical protein [Gemmataceae bacterium]